MGFVQKAKELDFFFLLSTVLDAIVLFKRGLKQRVKHVDIFTSWRCMAVTSFSSHGLSQTRTTSHTKGETDSIFSNLKHAKTIRFENNTHITASKNMVPEEVMLSLDLMWRQLWKTTFCSCWAESKTPKDKQKASQVWLRKCLVNCGSDLSKKNMKCIFLDR